MARKTDREARGGPVKLPDGSEVPRLPGYQLWMWEEDFCGVISFRWEPGTSRLPAHVLGHIGYGVVPWMRRRGCATAALALMRERVRAEGLRYADITCDVDNEPSRKVIVAAGGAPFLRFDKPASNGGTPSFRSRWYTGVPHPIEVETERLRLRQWRDQDLAPFGALGADPEVMQHFPACLSREESDAVVARARAGIERRGWGLWAVERRADGAFLGMAGVTVVPEHHAVRSSGAARGAPAAPAPPVPDYRFFPTIEMSVSFTFWLVSMSSHGFWMVTITSLPWKVAPCALPVPTSLSPDCLR